MVMFNGLFCVLIYEAETSGNKVLLNETRGAGQLHVTGKTSWVPEVESESTRLCPQC